jgi:hypothetical protein
MHDLLRPAFAVPARLRTVPHQPPGVPTRRCAMSRGVPLSVIGVLVSLPLVAAQDPRVAAFPNPTWNGQHIDRCLHWGQDCGKPAADYFCRTKGFADAQDFRYGPLRPTLVVGDNKVCDAEGCGGFTEIHCTGQPSWSALESALISGPPKGAQRPKLSPAEHEKQVEARCDELMASILMLRLLLDEPVQTSESFENHSRDWVVLMGPCLKRGWALTGFDARNPGIMALLQPSGAADQPQAPPPTKDGRPWSWSGKGLCRTEYEGHDRGNQHYDPSPPYETHVDLEAWWRDKLGMYEVKFGCGKVFGKQRDFTFDDQCDQSASANPVAGCYHKCRDTYRLSNGHVSIDVDRATYSVDFEDDASGSWGTYKGRTSCTFLNLR